MGRKGVSKRKPSKAKNLKGSNDGGNGTGTSVSRLAEAAPQSIAKGEAISENKNSKKK